MQNNNSAQKKKKVNSSVLFLNVNSLMGKIPAVPQTRL